MDNAVYVDKTSFADFSVRRFYTSTVSMSLPMARMYGPIPNHVIELKAVPHPAAPPLEVGSSVVVPAIQRVAPNLTVGGKGIRRAARNGGDFG